MSLFNGPLFIVGMPRSGTKLLRDLLNRHPRISVPVSESHFIPHFAQIFGNTPDFTEPTSLDRLYAELKKTNFFENMQRRGYDLTRDKLDAIKGSTDWCPVLEFIFRFYADCSADTSVIWGDKTPSYLNHMHLLKQLCPNARFIHIIRDPRDYCLSLRNTWGKSIYRGAERWRREIERARRVAPDLGHDYLEIRYEDLLRQPETVLRRICDAIGCDFVDEMKSSGRTTERFGDARGRSDIVADNCGKYLGQFSPREIKRIEEIVEPVMRSLRYEPETGGSFRPMTAQGLKFLTVRDGLAMTWFYVKNKGALAGLRYQWLALRRTSGRR